MRVAFALLKLLTFFQQKISMYLPYFKINNADPDQLASEKPNDPDLCCLQKWGISGFSRTRVKWTGSWMGTDSSTKHAWVIQKRKT